MGPGLELGRALYDEVVADVLARALPQRSWSAGLIGAGSEILGYDDARSTDHDWGPRVQILLTSDAAPQERERIGVELDRALPAAFRGHQVRFATSHDPRVRHHVEVVARSRFFDDQLGFDPLQSMTAQRWIAAPMSRLAGLVAGEVFTDPTGELAATRAALRWYPDDLWRWVLACQWQRIAEEAPFAGRCAERGDLLGAGLQVARVARDVVRLWLLLARRYPPYGKWLGTAFASLPDSATVAEQLRRALVATEWPEQQAHLGEAMMATARRQNQIGLSAPVAETLRPFHDRPFLIVDALGFVASLRCAITDPATRALPLCGVVDQFFDSVDVLGRPAMLAAAADDVVGGCP